MAIVGAYLAVTALLFGVLGIRSGSDTPRYEEAAAKLLAGRAIDGKARSYPGYVAVVAASRAAGCGRTGVVVLQCLAGLGAIGAAYSAGRALGGRNAGLASAGLLAVNADLWRFNFYILTDTLYAAALVALTALAIRFMRTRRGSDLALSAVAMIVVVLVRPNGVAVLPLLGMFLLVRSRYGWLRWMLPVVLAGLAVAAVEIPMLHQRIATEEPQVHLLAGTVVWGGAWKFPMPAHEQGAERDWTAAGSYVLRHPLASLALAATRVGVELVHMRAVYSLAHNAVIALFYLPLYALAALGFIRHRRDAAAQLIVVVAGSQLLVVALLFADWDGRFLLHLVPLLSVLAGVGASTLRWRRVGAPAA